MEPGSLFAIQSLDVLEFLLMIIWSKGEMINERATNFGFPQRECSVILAAPLRTAVIMSKR